MTETGDTRTTKTIPRSFALVSQEGGSFIIAPEPSGRLNFRVELPGGACNSRMDASAVQMVRDYLTEWLEAVQ